MRKIRRVIASVFLLPLAPPTAPGSAQSQKSLALALASIGGAIETLANAKYHFFPEKLYGRR